MKKIYKIKLGEVLYTLVSPTELDKKDVDEWKRNLRKDWRERQKAEEQERLAYQGVLARREALKKRLNLTDEDIEEIVETFDLH